MNVKGFYRLKDGRNVFIREAFVEDAERLHEFYEKVTSQTPYLITKPEEVLDVYSERQLIKMYSSMDNRLYLVAFYAANVVGMLKLAGNRRKRVKHVAELSIAVLEDFQGVGLGSTLMKLSLEWARLHGIKRVELTVIEENRRAIRLYEKFGFQVEGRLKSYARLDERFVDALLMAKLL